MAGHYDSHPDPQLNRRVVCVRCAKIKQACDGGSPCLRRMRLDVTCEPNISGISAVGQSASALKPARITRTHTGCLTCKRRRKKCTEERPKCSDCRRLCLDYIYQLPASGPRRKSNLPQSMAAASFPARYAEDSLKTLNPGDDTLDINLDILDGASATSLQNELEEWAKVHQLSESPSDLRVSSQEAATQQATIAFEQALQL